MPTTIPERNPEPMRFDVGRAIELGWKGYTQNFAMGALLVFVYVLLVFAAMFSVVGIIFALPHLAIGVTLLGYYMVRGKVFTSMLFVGFRRYGTVLGAVLILWIFNLIVAAIFSGPYYYHLVQAMLPEVAGSGSWYARFVQASTDASVQNWAALQYLAYPIQFYFQGRLLLLFPLIVEEGMGVSEAFAETWRVSRSVQWQLFLFMFLATVLAFLAIFAGMLGLIVGIFFTLPFPVALFGAAIQQMFEIRRQGGGGV